MVDLLGLVRTTPEKFENAALFLRLGQPFTLIRHETQLFDNSLQAGGFWKRWLCVFVWTENILKTVLFENDKIPIIMFGLFSRDSETSVFKSSGEVCTENIWCIFGVKPQFSNSSGVVWTGRKGSKKMERGKHISLFLVHAAHQVCEHVYN